jgi:iron complex outermembrane recepter protein
MSVRVCVSVAAAAAASIAGVSGVSAQEAQEVLELPEIVVTTPSPVAKPAKKKPAKQTVAAPAPSAQQEAAPPAQPPDLVPLPGAIAADHDSFVAVTVTTSSEFLADGGATLTDTLQMKPGVSGTTFAAGANRPVIRGLDSYRVRTQENGIGTHDVAAISEDHAVPVDPMAVGRVEVVRGPATLRYGSQAMGGVVAVENQRIPTFVPPKGLQGVVSGALSSVDDGAEAGFSVTGGAGGVAVHADGFRRNAEDYDSPDGVVGNSFVQSEGGSVGASLIGPDGYVGVAYARFESLYGVPGEEADEGVNPRIDMVQDKVLAKGEWRMRSSGIEAVRFWFGASDYAHSEFAMHHHEDEDEDEDHDEHEHEHEEEGFSLGSRFTNRQQEARIEVQHQPFLTGLGAFSGAVGFHIDSRETRGQSFEGDSLLEPAQTMSVAAFWFEELSLTQDLRFQAATRIEHTTVDGSGWSDISDPEAPVVFAGEREFVPVSGSAGFLYDLPFDTVVRLTGQYVERSPDAAELFSKGMHEATGTFEIGNPFLDKEKAATIEAGLKKATGPLRFDASAYYTRYNGFIYRQLTGVECGTFLSECGEDDHDEDEHEHETFDQVFFQQRDATFYGAELAMQLDVARVWNGVWGVDAQYDFVRAKFSNGENVPRIPPHRLGGGIYYHDAKWLARAGLLHAFDQDDFGVNEIATPGYTLVSAEVSYTMQLEETNGAIPELTIGLRGENLADDEVLNHTSFKRSENVLLPGASVRLFGKVRLN